MNMNTQTRFIDATSGAARASLLILIALSAAMPVLDSRAQLPVNLGTAANFAVLAGQAITSTQGGVINGDVGVNPGSAFTLGIPPVVVNGTTYLAEAVSLQAQNDLITAYNDAAGRGVPTLIAGGQLGGLTLAPGVYRDNGAPASLNLTGILTLDAGGDPNAVWVFQTASTLIAEVDSSVVLINGAQSCNIFWQVTSSATLRTRASFMGSIIALTDITLENLATVNGRILARNGSVVLDADVVSVPCGQSMLAGVPPDTTVECNRIPEAPPVIFTDTCSTQSVVAVLSEVILSGNCPNSFEIQRIWNATSSCSGSISATQMVFVVDTLPPVVTCPENFNVPCVGEIPPADPELILAQDNCEGLVTVIHVGDSTPTSLCGGTVTRTYRATDVCGNSSECTQLISINDTLPPVINCPGRFADLAGCGAATNAVPDLRSIATASDTCGTATITQDPAPGTLYTGSILVTLTATDGCGNTASCTTMVDQIATLGNFIWFDFDHNGVQDPGEPGVQGVQIELLDSASIVLSTNTTDLAGYYQFCVAPGTYSARVVPASLPPGGYLFTLQNQTSVDLDSSVDITTGQSEQVTLAAGESNQTLDAGIYRPMCLGDTVWVDVARDQSTAGDNLEVLGIPNVLLNLYSVTGAVETLVISTRTVAIAGNSGYYCFPDLPPGQYCVRIDMTTVPTGYQLTTEGVFCFTVQEGQSIDTLDFGVIDESTAIDLASFTATPVAGGVRVDWKTGSEVGNLGFQVTRSARLNGARVPVNEWLVEGQGTGSGSAYTLMDAAVVDGPAFYWLEDFDLEGSSTVHGPVRVGVNLLAQSAPVVQRAGSHIIPCASPETMTVWAGAVELPSFILEGALLVVVSGEGTLRLESAAQPLRMVSQDATPVEGQPLQVVLLDGDVVEWTTAAGVKATLLRSGGGHAEIVDVSDPAAPVRLTGVLLQVNGESALYLAARPGALLQAVRH